MENQFWLSFKGRLEFWKSIYLYGWRWVVLVIWGIPFGSIATYDTIQASVKRVGDSSIMGRVPYISSC